MSGIVRVFIRVDSRDSRGENMTEELICRDECYKSLSATGLQSGLLVNFGAFPKLQWERLVFTKKNLPANHAKERE